MAKAPTLTTITSGYASQTQLNGNFTAIEEAFENTLSLDGSTPNAMNADLDLNGNDLINGGVINATSIVIGGVDLADSVTQAGASADAAAVSAAAALVSETNAAASEAYVAGVEANLPDWQGEWLTATAYDTGDLVRYDGSTYICLVAHTSGTFSTDLSALKWELFAQKGAAGAGTGDMVAANNLSDVANAATSLANIGGQPLDATLTALAGITTAADKLIYATGSDTFSTTDLTAFGRTLIDDADASTARTTLGLGTAAVATLIDDDTFATATSSNISSAESTKAYVDTVAAAFETFGAGQKWQDVSSSRSAGTSYQNTTGKTIVVSVGLPNLASRWLQVSEDNSTWITVGWPPQNGAIAVVKHGDYYRVTNSYTAGQWAEMR